MTPVIASVLDELSMTSGHIDGTLIVLIEIHLVANNVNNVGATGPHKIHY